MLNSGRKIVILYAKFGDGHFQVANALKQRFAERGIAEAVLCDPFGESHPAWNRWAQSFYYRSTSQFPKLYGLGYSLTDRIPSSSALGDWLHSLGADRLARTIDEERPDAVIQTFPLLTMSYLRQAAGFRIPTYTVLTDYVLHRRWLHPETDRYFVATEELKRRLEEAGVAPERIVVSGIPIRERFRQPDPAAASAASAGGASDRPSVLVMAGAYGVSLEVGKLVQALLAKGGFFIRLVCGRNEMLRERMSIQFADEPRVAVYGFVERIERLMAQASCIVTKAGGITLTEAVALGLPVVTYRPIPGQEQGNAEYWRGKGMLTIANRIDEAAEQAVRWAAAGRSGAAAGYSAVGAADAIAGAVLNDLRTAAPPARAAVYAPGPGRRLRAKFRTP